MKPVPGKQYTTEPGDTLPNIAARAYGLTGNWTLIRDANQFTLKTDDLESVQAGETIFIPPDPVLEDLRNELSNL